MHALPLTQQCKGERTSRFSQRTDKRFSVTPEDGPFLALVKLARLEGHTRDTHEANWPDRKLYDGMLDAPCSNSTHTTAYLDLILWPKARCIRNRSKHQ